MATTPRVPASDRPVARVVPLLGLPQLDRFYDYQVPEGLSAAAQPGVRIRVRFAGRKVDALIIERLSDTDHSGELAWIDRVISELVVYPPATARLVDSLALRYAGTRSDIIRAAIPPRHAAAEKAALAATTTWEELGEVSEPDLSDWMAYAHGQSFVDAVLGGAPARAAWQMLPGRDWLQALSALIVKTALTGGGVLVVVPDQRDVDRLVDACTQHVSPKHITVLNSQLGPQARYRRFVDILLGRSRIVIGTRSAAFAPVADLRLAVLLHDGDDNLVDPRAPYVHAREVLTTRSAQSGCAMIIGGFHRTAETHLLVERGWAHNLIAPPPVLRAVSPRIRAVGDNDAALDRDPHARTARIPGVAFAAVRKALESGAPVLFQVPRKGYVPTLACGSCREPARCRHCHGPLSLPHAVGEEPVAPTCRWCGRADARYRCPECGAMRLRAVVIGSERTAEELGRAFPGYPVVASGGSHVVGEVGDSPRIVISTPGAEPVAEQGYGALVILDTWAFLGQQNLRAGEQALGRWMNAASLVRPYERGGEVVVVADPGLAVVQSLIRFDAAGAAAREFAERADTHLPPAAHMAAVDGPEHSLGVFFDALQHSSELPAGTEILGPVDLPPGTTLPGDYDASTYGPAQRMLVRCPLASRNALGKALKSALVQRAVRKENLPLRVQVDPLNIG